MKKASVAGGKTSAGDRSLVALFAEIFCKEVTGRKMYFILMKGSDFSGWSMALRSGAGAGARPDSGWQEKQAQHCA
jgi:hypothetical protein